MSKWIKPESTDFIDFINTELSHFKTTKVEKETCKDTKGEVVKLTPTNYQQILQYLINEDTPYRGLLLFHGLGSGKTFTSLNISENINREVVVLLPASLKPRWIEEFSKIDPVKYGRPSNYSLLEDKEKKAIDKNIYDTISKKYTFISHNAYNVADKLFELRRKEFIKVPTALGDGADGEFDSGYVVKKIGSLDNKLLIIDEVHNVLTNIISEGSKNGARIYEMIMKAKNLKILALSGTPLINDPFEIAPLFNMLRGPMYIGNELFTAFPEDYVKFREYFVDLSEYGIKNKNIFQERIVGLVSYIRGSSDENLEVYPRKEMEYVNLPMSLYQWKVYIKARQKEIEKERESGKFLKVQQSVSKLKRPFPDSSVDFKIGSRVACNFAFPEEIDKPPAMKPTETAGDFKKRINETLNQLTKEHLVDNLGMYSPKYKFMIDYLNKNTKGLTIVYSDFLTLEGIGIFKKVLEFNGFTKYREGTGKDYFRYIEFSGNIDDVERSSSIKAYTDPNNQDGKTARILLGTSAMAEGLDLKNVRTIFLMEPYFHNIILKQVIGRGVRRCSHVSLPEKERLVKVFLLVANKPVGDLTYPSGDKMTTDQMLLTRALQKDKLNKSFLDAMKEIAIDCDLNSEINKSIKDPVECVHCSGDYKGKKMYYDDIKLHMIKGKNNCIHEDLSISETVELQGKEYGIDNKNNLYDLTFEPPKKVGKLKDFLQNIKEKEKKQKVEKILMQRKQEKQKEIKQKEIKQKENKKENKKETKQEKQKETKKETKQRETKKENKKKGYDIVNKVI